MKWKAASVGRPDLQRLYGARANCRHLEMLFFAAAPYSRLAIAYADEVGMALFGYSPLGDIEPANSVACRMVATASKQRRTSNAVLQATALNRSLTAILDDMPAVPRRASDWLKRAEQRWRDATTGKADRGDSSGEQLRSAEFGVPSGEQTVRRPASCRRDRETLDKIIKSAASKRRSGKTTGSSDR